MPVITGSGPVTAGRGGDSVAYYESVFAAKYGAAAGNAYAAYAAAHPSLSPYEAANDYAELILVRGLDSALQAGISGGVAVDTGTAQGAAKGAENAVAALTPGQWLNKLGSIFTSRGTWIRVAEGVLGIALILVAIAELGKGTAIGKAAKKVPFI